MGKGLSLKRAVLLLLVSSSFIGCTGQMASGNHAKSDSKEAVIESGFQYGTIIEQVADADETINERPVKYQAVLLDEPVSLNVFLEDAEITHRLWRVRVIEISGGAEFLEKNVNKRVKLSLVEDCTDSSSPYVYEDVICSVNSISVIN